MAPLPAPGRRVPVSTYRLQLRPKGQDHPGFGFDDAAAVVPYLADLGITDLYCSPWLQAAPGSAHGYDVIDHSRLNEELGGAQAWERLWAACRSAGLGIVLDVVPNHMAVSEPQSQNAAWWSVLREGRQSPYAAWFDIDWSRPVMVPILGGPLEEVLDELVVDGDRIRYYDHEVPIAEGTLVDGDLLATLAAQHYRLCHWVEASQELSYRRFFDVTTLAGLRVEDPAVFDATHALVVAQVQAGAVSGLRIDHPDGLADPAGYLDRLAGATGSPWVVVEKILEPGEHLPQSWSCSGTTGYDALHDVLGLFVDPAGEAALTGLWQEAAGRDASYDVMVDESKRLVLRDVLGAEVERLTRLAEEVAGATPGLREALVEVLAGFGVYRAYVPAAGPADDDAKAHVGAAVAKAGAARPDLTAAIETVMQLALAEGPATAAAREFVTRFQQTCGPVMAKGVEDTAFYRFLRLSALNEVGGDPGRFGLSVADFHTACAQRQATWPLSMTALSTHDTKRSEDVRARLVLLSECADEWAAAVRRWSERARRHCGTAGPDRATEQLIWQTLVGAWPLSADRAAAYLQKAVREAKAHTSWLAPNASYEQAVDGFVRGVLADQEVSADVAQFVGRLDPAWRTTSVAQKLVQLTMPGVADVYQGTELADLSLVDPDNRRPVDFGQRRHLLAELAGGPDAGEAAKLRVTAAALRLRRRQPEAFLADATYEPLDAGRRAVAFCRTDAVVTVAPIRAVAVQRDGWAQDAVQLPSGRWRDVLTGARWAGPARLADLLSPLPVALLERDHVT